MLNHYNAVAHQAENSCKEAAMDEDEALSGRPSAQLGLWGKQHSSNRDAGISHAADTRVHVAY
jgi:hypothetical protein